VEKHRCKLTFLVYCSSSKRKKIMIEFNPIVAPGQVRSDGFIKAKLAHGQGFSLLLVDRLYVERAGDWSFFESSMFGPPQLAFHDEDALAHVWIDTERGDNLFVTFTNNDLVKTLPDGAQLFACVITGPADFDMRSSGDARRTPDGIFELRLFHHTAPGTLPLIEASEHVRGSQWNLQGNKRLENVGYAYLTNRSEITTDEDLAAVAMATDRQFGLLLDEEEPPHGVIVIEVTRSATTDRSATLALWVPDYIIASAHLLRHDQRAAMGVFYEVVLPAVFRVGLQPGAVLNFSGNVAATPTTSLKGFDYVIVGDARTKTGIVAPYDEENTTSICKIERMEDGDFLTFWRDNANTDLFGGAIVEHQAFAGPA
jgi:hypothetical protein